MVYRGLAGFLNTIFASLAPEDTLLHVLGVVILVVGRDVTSVGVILILRIRDTLDDVTDGNTGAGAYGRISENTAEVIRITGTALVAPGFGAVGIDGNPLLDHHVAKGRLTAAEGGQGAAHARRSD